MRLVSTKDNDITSTFEDALFTPMPSDGGLWFFEKIDKMNDEFLENWKLMTLPEIGFNVFRHFDPEKEVSDEDLKKICEDSFNFPLKVKKLSDKIIVAELFHGKTMAFKDFGARFLARMMQHFNRKIHIVTATSGDTGSAVSDAFCELTNIPVSILYPKGMVSDVQESQMTTQGDNVTAYEVDGTFDICQDMVKMAFLDDEINKEISSANSINIGRLLGQVFYYFIIVKETLLLTEKKEVIISIPSGNVGNITSCAIAKRLGLPFKLMIGACNTNNCFATYINENKFVLKDVIRTYSNAMDISRPSNLERLKIIYNNKKFGDDILGYTTTDKTTLAVIRLFSERYKYIMCPHTACAADALLSNFDDTSIGVIVSTAHYIKFNKTVEKALRKKTEIPENIKNLLEKEKKKISIDADYDKFKNLLIRGGTGL
jgi:threonine synthase